MGESVECHSGFTYAEKPVALTYLGQRLEVAEILAQGRIPEEKWFRVRTSDGRAFLLRFGEVSGEWQIQQL
jgi:hypothetical protein